MKNYLEYFQNDSTFVSPEHTMKLKDKNGEIIGEKPKTNELMLAEDMKTLISNIRNIFIQRNELEKNLPEIRENKPNIIAPSPKYTLDRFRKREVVPGVPTGFMFNFIKSASNL